MSPKKELLWGLWVSTLRIQTQKRDEAPNMPHRFDLNRNLKPHPSKATQIWDKPHQADPRKQPEPRKAPSTPGPR